jgi:ATP-dependent RNA helicase DDX46/PRP5
MLTICIILSLTTGRAGNTGICFTFVNSNDEAKFAPIIVRALSEAGQFENIDPHLKKLAEAFKIKVEKGEAKLAGSGFKGKGYTYDSSELNEAQRMARIEKRQALIEAGLLDDDEDPLTSDIVSKRSKLDVLEKDNNTVKDSTTQIIIPENLTPELLALPGMKEALLRTAGIIPTDTTCGKHDEWGNPHIRQPVQTSDNHWVQEFEINDYPREARWKVTQKETTSRLQEEFRTAVTLKGSYVPLGQEPVDGQRKLYLHLEATSDTNLRNGVLEINRLLNEETLRVGAKSNVPSSHKYNVLG